MHAPVEVAGGPLLINSVVFEDVPGVEDTLQEELVVMVAHPEITIARGDADTLLQVDDRGEGRKSSALTRPVGALVLRKSEAGGGIYDLDPAGGVLVSNRRAMAQFLDLIATFSKEAEDKELKRDEAAETLKQLDNFAE
jgi:hypothetical protein